MIKKFDYDTKVALTTCFMIFCLTAGTIMGKIPSDVWATIFTAISSGYFGSLYGGSQIKNKQEFDSYK